MTLEKLIERWRERVRYWYQDNPRAPQSAGLSYVEDCADDLAAYLKSIEYRPGLPSVAEVRAHEVAGGWWQRRQADGPPQCVEVYMQGDVIMAEDSHRQYVATANYSYRPCTPDGTPVPRASTPPAQEGT